MGRINSIESKTEKEGTLFTNQSIKLTHHIRGKGKNLHGLLHPLNEKGVAHGMRIVKQQEVGMVC